MAKLNSKQKAFLFAQKGTKKASLKVQNSPEGLEEGACAVTSINSNGVDGTH